MILDGALQFTGTLGTVSNVIDLVNARDMGVGDNPAVKLMCVVRTTFTGGTSLQVQFQGAPDAGGGTPGTYVTYAESAAVLEADLVAGRYLLPIDVPRPPPGAALPRYLRLQYVTAGTHGAGQIYAALVLDRQDYPIYPSGITVPN
jgi:hypothetical protein